MGAEIETFQISDDKQVALFYEEASDCPRDNWYMLTGYVNVNRDKDYVDVPEVHNDPTGGIKEAYSRFDEPEHVIRWARIFHNLTLEYESGFGMHEGFWFANPEDMKTNWPELTPGSPEYVQKEHEVIDGDRSVYLQWARGEVYFVLLKERVEYQKVGDESERIERWETTDSIGDLYADDGESAEHLALSAALDNFDLTDSEVSEIRQRLGMKEGAAR